MKNKLWIIILIMGISLTISIAYSIVLSQKNEVSKKTVTTTSIIEMRATTVTIKNTLKGTGIIEYKEKNIQQEQQIPNETINNNLEEPNPSIEKVYQISLLIDEKDLSKVELNQDVEISIKDENTNSNINYKGKVIKINKNENNKSTIDVEIVDANEIIKENMEATCNVIIEEADNVVALPIEAIQKNENNEEYVDVVQSDGTTKEVLIKTGISDESYVEITSGLKVGDRVQIVKSSTTIQYEGNEISE